MELYPTHPHAFMAYTHNFRSVFLSVDTVKFGGLLTTLRKEPVITIFRAGLLTRLHGVIKLQSYFPASL